MPGTWRGSSRFGVRVFRHFSDADEVEKDEPFDLIGYQGSSSGGSVLDMFTPIYKESRVLDLQFVLVFMGVLDIFSTALFLRASL